MASLMPFYVKSHLQLYFSFGLVLFRSRLFWFVLLLWFGISIVICKDREMGNANIILMLIQWRKADSYKQIDASKRYLSVLPL